MRDMKNGCKDGMEDAVQGKKFCGVSAEGTSQPIDDLDISIRAHNSLARLGCRAIGDCMLLKEEQILNLKNLGEKTRDEIAHALINHSIKETSWDRFIFPK